MADEVGEFFAGNWQIGFRGNGKAEVDVDFPKSTDRMEATRFCGNELHVLKEHRNHGEARFLRDVIETGLAGTDVNTVASSAFGENDEVKFVGGAAKLLEFANATRVELAAFEQKADATAENAFDPGGVPDGFVAKNENRIAA